MGQKSFSENVQDLRKLIENEEAYIGERRVFRDIIQQREEEVVASERAFGPQSIIGMEIQGYISFETRSNPDRNPSDKIQIDGLKLEIEEKQKGIREENDRLAEAGTFSMAGFQLVHVARREESGINWRATSRVPAGHARSTARVEELESAMRALELKLEVLES